MFDEVIRKILSAIGQKDMSRESYPKFSGEGYAAYRIDPKNFHEIRKFNRDKKIAFVDGGNAEIIGSASFSLSLLRICYALYQDSKKLGFKRFEILSFTQAVSQGNEIFYKTSFFKTPNSIDLGDISFSSLDNSLMVGVNRAEIGNVANAIRRLAELKVAKFVADSKIADMVVLDGNLQATLTSENKYLDELYESCSRNNILLSALSKTSSLFTDDGNLLSAVLEDISALGSWFYHPIAEISNPSHKAEMFFVKFHDKSRHIFRFEIFNMQKSNAEEVINSLASNSNDPVFIGYPYGMVEADRIARIGKNERESLKARFLFRLQDKNIEKYLNSRNAHEILDKISF
ncbi:DNA double-strand break repair nuclease NurA [Candidatus Woesearchaeota archaeon]|nr:DNA double-strand break repair nuclease NurA [Candidatus Woesearchaeota archaeon]